MAAAPYILCYGAAAMTVLERIRATGAERVNFTPVQGGTVTMAPTLSRGLCRWHPVPGPRPRFQA
jgi:hypothetical protein